MSDGITEADRCCRELTDKDFENARQKSKTNKDREIKFKNLYIAVNELVNRLGADGEITTRACEFDQVMDRLYDLDGGIFDVDLVFHKANMKKLYEFTALLECSVIIAADNKEDARTEIETYEKAWIETGDFIGVQNIDLVDVRNPDSQDLDVLNDQAHAVV